MEDELATKYCTNCKKNIASSNFSIHEMHCKRHIVLCDYCEEPVPRSEMDEHLEDYHGNTECDWCHQNMERYLLEHHKEEECPEREVLCKYCDLKVKVSVFREHEATCGSRTDECDVCKKRVMLRYMDDHLKNDCISKPAPRKFVNRHKKQSATVSDGKRTVRADHSNRANLPVASNRQPKVMATHSRVGEYSPEDEDDVVAVQPITRHPFIHPSTSLVRSDGPAPKPDGLIPEQDRPVPIINRPDIPVLIPPDRPIPKPRPLPIPESPVPMPDRHVPMPERPVLMPDRPVPMPERPVPMPDRPVPMSDRPVPMLDKLVPTDDDHSSTSNPTMVLDQGWIGSVANAAKNDKELDLMIASTLHHEELRKNEANYTQPTKAQIEEDIPPNPASVSDEELALQLQREYDQQRERSFHDANLAKRLQKDTPTAGNTNVLDSVLNNPSHAHQLYDQLDEYPREDSLLARQLQEEERFTTGGEDDGRLNTMMIYDRAVIHEREERERLKRIERDRELASTLQQQEEELQERVNPPLHDAHHHHPTETVPQYHYQSNPVVPPQPNALTLEAYEDDDDDDIRERGVFPDSKQEDTPTSSPVNYGIPCEICGETIAFEEYQQHLETMHPQFTGYVGRFQSHDAVYRPPSRPIDSPPPPRHPKINHTPYSSTEPDDKVVCEFCGDKFSARISEIHAFACSKNPEKQLKNVYRNPGIVNEVVTSGNTTNEDDVQEEETPTIPCEFCRKDIPIPEYTDHSAQCQRNHFARLSQYTTTRKDEHGYEDQIGIPCVKCSKLIPPTNIHIHEVQCRGTPEKITPAGPVLHSHGIVHSSSGSVHRIQHNNKPLVTLPAVTRPEVTATPTVLHSMKPVNTVTGPQQTTGTLSDSDDNEEVGTGVVQSNGPASDQYSASEGFLFCRYCGKRFVISKLDRHQRECDKRRQRPPFPNNTAVNSLPSNINSLKQEDHHASPTASIMKISDKQTPTYIETKRREKQRAGLISILPTDERGGILDTRQRMKLTSKSMATSTAIRSNGNSRTTGSAPYSGIRDLSIHGRPSNGQGRRQDGLYTGNYKSKTYSRKNSNGEDEYGVHIDDSGTVADSSHTNPRGRNP